MKIYGLRLMCILAVLAGLLVASGQVDVVYAYDTDDNTDRLSSSQAYTFSPGYLNAAKQQAKSILRQESTQKSFFEQMVEYVQSKLASMAEEAAEDKGNVKLNLQRRVGVTAGSSQGLAGVLVTGPRRAINIGSGIDQQYVNGHLAAETINGVRYNYAGFSTDSSDTIQAAVDRAGEGEVVIVKDKAMNTSTGNYLGFTINKSLRVYGGYDSSGNISEATNVYGGMIGLRMYNPIIIQGVNDRPVKVSGFNSTLLGSSSAGSLATLLNLLVGSRLGAYTILDSSNVTITSCTSRGLQGIFVSNSNVSISNSDIQGVFNAIKATNSSITAESNNICGSGFWMYSTFFFVGLTGTGNGIVADNSNLFLNNNNITNAGMGNDIILKNGSYTSYVIASLSLPSVPSLVAPDDRTLSISKGQYYNEFGRNPTSSNPYLISDHKNISPKKVTDIFKGILLKNEDMGPQIGIMEPALIARLVDESLRGDGELTNEEMNVVMRLANILRNPTEDQRLVIDSLKGLLQDINNVESEGDAGIDPELKKASDNLIQMVANILLAQAIPDLLKEGDVHDIKVIFNEMDTVKSKLMLDYETSTAPYYEKMKDDILKNMNVLQVNNIVSKTLSEEQLRSMPRSELDKVIEKLKKLEKRSFEEGYMLQQEAKYRKEYLDPNKQKLEQGMKDLLQGIMKKLDSVLEAAPKK